MAPPRDYQSWEDFEEDGDVPLDAGVGDAPADEDALPLPALAWEDDAGEADPEAEALAAIAAAEAEMGAPPASVDELIARLPSDDPQVAQLKKVAALAKETERIRGEMAKLTGKEPAADPRYPAFTDAKGAKGAERARLAALEALRERAREAVVATRAAAGRAGAEERARTSRWPGGVASQGRTGGAGGMASGELGRIRDEILAAGRDAAGRPDDAIRARAGRQYGAWRERWSGVEAELRTVTTEAKTGPGRMRLAERGLDLVRGLPAAERLTKALPEAARALPVVAALTRPGEAKRGLTDRAAPERVPLAERLRGLTEPKKGAPGERGRRDGAAADPYARDGADPYARDGADDRFADDAPADDRFADDAPAGDGDGSARGRERDRDDAAPDETDDAGGPDRRAARAERRARAKEDRDWARDARARGEDRSAVRDELRERRRQRNDDARTSRRRDRD